MAELLGYGLPDVWAGSPADCAGKPPDGMIEALDDWVCRLDGKAAVAPDGDAGAPSGTTTPLIFVPAVILHAIATGRPVAVTL